MGIGVKHWGLCLLACLLLGCAPEQPSDVGEVEEAGELEETAGVGAQASVEVAAVPDAGSDGSSVAFVPEQFVVPELVETEGFKVVPLGPDLVDIDYAAYMSSIEHLQQTFTRSTSWPRADITAEEAMLDMQTEQGRFQRRESFAYAVLSPDGSVERGCIYVYPSSKPGYDAEVRLWVTKAEYDAGFDAQLYAWAQQWVGEVWPFQQVAYPGRAIDWATWDALPDLDVPAADQLAADLASAEALIDAFYSFDPEQLAPLLAHAPDSAESILYYQGWAEGGNYKIVERADCVAESADTISCAITVEDDPVLALQTGFNVTDTFTLTFKDGLITAIDTSSNDQPIYYAARDWVREQNPEIMNGPCKDSFAGGKTPGDCARAMTEGYRQYYQQVVAPAQNVE